MRMSDEINENYCTAPQILNCHEPTDMRSFAVGLRRLDRVYKAFRRQADVRGGRPLHDKYRSDQERAR